MSVMLATTNPEAAMAMDPGKDRRVPYEGQVLIFHMRPGEGCGGKLRALAICDRVEDDDHVELIVIHSADNLITRWKIPRRTDQNPVNAWSFNEWDERHYRPATAEVDAPKPEGHLTWDDVKAMHAEIAMLRNKVAVLESVSNERRGSAQMKLDRARNKGKR